MGSRGDVVSGRSKQRKRKSREEVSGNQCWVVGACLGDDVVVIGVVVTAERTTVYPAKSVKAAGWVSGSKVSQRDDGGSRQFKQRRGSANPASGFLLVFWHFFRGVTDGALG